jgi:hypothetical protein
MPVAADGVRVDDAPDGSVAERVAAGQREAARRRPAARAGASRRGAAASHGHRCSRCVGSRPAPPAACSRPARAPRTSSRSCHARPVASSGVPGTGRSIRSVNPPSHRPLSYWQSALSAGAMAGGSPANGAEAFGARSQHTGVLAERLVSPTPDVASDSRIGTRTASRWWCIPTLAGRTTRTAWAGSSALRRRMRVSCGAVGRARRPPFRPQQH